MGLVKLTFDGANNTAKSASDINALMFSSKTGIIKGLKNECKYTYANNVLTFQDGYISVCGRVIYLEEGTSIAITPTGTFFGYVIVLVNTLNNSVALTSKEGPSYPTLIQEDLNLANGVYEFAIAKYSKTSTSVTIDVSFTPQYIIPITELIGNLEARINDTLDTMTTNFNHSMDMMKDGLSSFYVMPSQVIGKNYTYALPLGNFSTCIMTVILNKNASIIMNGSILLGRSQSSIKYHYLGYDHNLYINTTVDNRVTLTVESDQHTLGTLYINR